MNGLFYQDVHDLSHSIVIDMTLTWRNFALHVQPDFDEAKGERPDFRDFQGRCEAGSGVDKNRFRIKDGAAALVVRIGVIGGEVVLPVKAAHRDEVFAPVNHVQVK